MTQTLATLLILTVFVFVGWRQGPAPTVVLIEPTADTFLVGPTRLRASVRPALPVPEGVVFQVDGLEICRPVTAPFECDWDAGPQVAARVVRVVATFSDGSRATAAVRTREMSVSETFVESVVVPAHVTDHTGRFVSGLGQSAFTLFEDGVVQSAALLSSSAVTPDVLVALDISKSMDSAIEDLKIAVRDFLIALPPNARVGLVAFNSNLFLLAPFDADPEARAAGISRLRAWGTTAIYDTMIRSVDLLRERGIRRALVLFTDGEDVASRASAESARLALQSRGVLLYIVATGRAASDVDLRTQLSTLARETGGAAYFASRLQDTSGSFQGIAEDMANQYLLAFTPTRPFGDGKWRRLSVEVNDRRYTVRARTGYFASRHAIREP